MFLPYYLKLVLSSFICLLVLTAGVGNGLMFIAVIRSKDYAHVYLASIAAADFLMCVAVFPFAIVNEHGQRWFFGQLFCELWLFLDSWLCAVTIYTLLLLCVELGSSVKGLMTLRLRTNTKISLVIVATWLFSAILGCISVFRQWFRLEAQTTLIDDQNYCIYLETPIIAIASASLIILAPFVWCTFVYILVVIRMTTFISIKQRYNLRIHQAKDTSKQSSFIYIANIYDKIRTLGIKLLIFSFCWMPFFVVKIMHSVCKDTCTTPFLRSLVVYLPFVSSWINPFIYGMLNKHIHSELQNMFACLKHRRKKRPVVCSNLTQNTAALGGSSKTLPTRTSHAEMTDVDNLELAKTQNQPAGSVVHYPISLNPHGMPVSSDIGSTRTQTREHSLLCDENLVCRTNLAVAGFQLKQTDHQQSMTSESNIETKPTGKESNTLTPILPSNSNVTPKKLKRRHLKTNNDQLRANLKYMPRNRIYEVNRSQSIKPWENSNFVQGSDILKYEKSARNKINKNSPLRDVTPYVDAFSPRNTVLLKEGSLQIKTPNRPRPHVIQKTSSNTAQVGTFVNDCLQAYEPSKKCFFVYKMTSLAKSEPQILAVQFQDPADTELKSEPMASSEQNPENFQQQTVQILEPTERIFELQQTSTTDRSAETHVFPEQTTSAQSSNEEFLHPSDVVTRQNNPVLDQSDNEHVQTCQDIQTFQEADDMPVTQKTLTVDVTHEDFQRKCLEPTSFLQGRKQFGDSAASPCIIEATHLSPKQVSDTSQTESLELQEDSTVGQKYTRDSSKDAIIAQQPHVSQPIIPGQEKNEHLDEESSVEESQRFSPMKTFSLDHGHGRQTRNLTKDTEMIHSQSYDMAHTQYSDTSDMQLAQTCNTKWKESPFQLQKSMSEHDFSGKQKETKRVGVHHLTVACKRSPLQNDQSHATISKGEPNLAVQGTALSSQQPVTIDFAEKMCVADETKPRPEPGSITEPACALGLSKKWSPKSVASSTSVQKLVEHFQKKSPKSNHEDNIDRLIRNEAGICQSKPNGTQKIHSSKNITDRQCRAANEDNLPNLKKEIELAEENAPSKQLIMDMTHTRALGRMSVAMTAPVEGCGQKLATGDLEKSFCTHIRDLVPNIRNEGDPSADKTECAYKPMVQLESVCLPPGNDTTQLHHQEGCSLENKPANDSQLCQTTTNAEDRYGEDTAVQSNPQQHDFSKLSTYNNDQAKLWSPQMFTFNIKPSEPNIPTAAACKTVSQPPELFDKYGKCRSSEHSETQLRITMNSPVRTKQVANNADNKPTRPRKPLHCIPRENHHNHATTVMKGTSCILNEKHATLTSCDRKTPRVSSSQTFASNDSRRTRKPADTKGKDAVQRPSSNNVPDKCVHHIPQAPKDRRAANSGFHKFKPQMISSVKMGEDLEYRRAQSLHQGIQNPKHIRPSKTTSRRNEPSPAKLSDGDNLKSRGVRTPRPSSRATAFTRDSLNVSTSIADAIQIPDISLFSQESHHIEPAKTRDSENNEASGRSESLENLMHVKSHPISPHSSDSFSNVVDANSELFIKGDTSYDNLMQLSSSESDGDNDTADFWGIKTLKPRRRFRVLDFRQTDNATSTGLKVCGSDSISSTSTLSGSVFESQPTGLLAAILTGTRPRDSITSRVVSSVKSAKEELDDFSFPRHPTQDFERKMKMKE